MGVTDRKALDDLLPVVYEQLHRAARRQRQRWHGDETLNTTALVHEAYVRLMDRSTAPQWQDPAHFMAVASIAMRQILLDYAKRKRAAKRGGGREPLAFHEIESLLGGQTDAPDARDEALIALNESLRRLEAVDARRCRVVECRFFGQMTIADTATALGISPATVKREWALAQAWLYRDLTRSGADR